MLEWMKRFSQEVEPNAVAAYVEQDAITKRVNEARLSAIGAKCVFRVPAADGQWRQLDGVILNVTDTALVVQERYFGWRYTINPAWFVGYVWERTAAAVEMTATA